MRTIKLSNSDLLIMVDDEDYEYLSQFKWWLNEDGGAYANITSSHDPRSMHKLLVKSPKGMTVDHENRNRLDNQKDNLRIATYSQNNYNTRKKTKWKRKPTSPFKGVYFDKSRNKWMAGIRVNSARKFLGRFDTEREAAEAYDKKAVQVAGEFALINFPCAT